jgi:hypothetical protein
MADGLKKPKSIEQYSDDELLRFAKARFQRDFDEKRKWIEEDKKLTDDFYDGNQWTTEELEILEKRGQPPVVINRIKPKVDSMVGMEIGMPVDTRPYNRGANDFSTAKFVAEGVRLIEQRNEFDIIESMVFKDQAINGLGWYKTGIFWDGLDAEFKILHLDNEDVFEDCNSKKNDLSDAKQVSESKWMTLEDAQELWPDKAEELEAFITEPASLTDHTTDPLIQKKPDQYDLKTESGYVNTHFCDKKQRRIRVTEMEFRTPYRETFMAAPELGTIKLSGGEAEWKKAQESFPDAHKWEQLCYRLHRVLFTWNCILEKKFNVAEYDKDGLFSYVPAVAFRERQKKNRFIGFVHQMLDPQREVNKRRSKMLHILNTNQVIMEDGAVDDIELTRKEMARPDGVIKTKGPQFRFEINKQNDVAQSHFALLQESKTEIDQVGVRGEIEGQSKATSGRDFELRTQQAIQSLREVLNNLRAARRQVFLRAINFMQEFWTDEMFIKITDDPEAEGITLNKKVIDPNTGQETIVNDLSVGKYDIIVDEAPETLNLESEIFEHLLKLGEIAAKQGQQVPLEMIIEASPLPNKQKLLQHLQKQQAAQAAAMQAAQAAQAGGIPA